MDFFRTSDKHANKALFVFLKQEQTNYKGIPLMAIR